MVLSVIGGDVLMILPKPPAFMCGKQAWVMKKVPRALIEVIRSYLQCAKFEDTAGRAMAEGTAGQWLWAESTGRANGCGLRAL